MISRAQLEEQLAQQRARRISAKRPTPRKGGKLVSVLVVLAILLVSSAAMIFAVRATTSTDLLVSPSPNVPSARYGGFFVNPAQIPNTPTATPETSFTMQVCTNIPQGRLHVRFAAGEGSDVRGYLAEGETIQAATDSQTIHGELWLRLLSPVAGWVNAHYLCEKGSSK
jgi:hypothetical protein